MLCIDRNGWFKVDWIWYFLSNLVSVLLHWFQMWTFSWIHHSNPSPSSSCLSPNFLFFRSLGLCFLEWSISGFSAWKLITFALFYFKLLEGDDFVGDDVKYTKFGCRPLFSGGLKVNKTRTSCLCSLRGNYRQINEMECWRQRMNYENTSITWLSGSMFVLN